MSISMYQSAVTRLTKDIADLRKQVGLENEKISRFRSDIVSVQKSFSNNMSLSNLNNKMQQIANKEKDMAQAQKKVADLESKISSKTGDLARNLNSLNSSEAQEQKKRDDEQEKRNEAQKKRDVEQKRQVEEQKKRDREALERMREITRETEKQSRLHSQMRDNRLVIDLTKLPIKITVLFFAANPKDQNQLALDEEIRSIQEKVRASDYRDSVELKSRWAVRSTDLLQSLNEERPNIVHFSGHGTQTDEIVFLDSNGNTKLVTKDAIVQLMNTTADSIQVVVFNTCFSSGQAEAITEHIDIAIGMNDSISDEAARIFSAQFYSSIGFGHSVGKAFNQAKAALMLEGIPEENTPQLFSKEDINPYEIILVRPE